MAWPNPGLLVGKSNNGGPGLDVRGKEGVLVGSGFYLKTPAPAFWGAFCPFPIDNKFPILSLKPRQKAKTRESSKPQNWRHLDFGSSNYLGPPCHLQCVLIY